MTKPIGYWLKEVDRLIELDFRRVLATERLTRRHWQVLNVISIGRRSLAEVDEVLAPFLGAEQPTAAPVVDDLIARGWVSRSDSGPLSLTAAGTSAHAELTERVEANRMRLTEGITAEEYRAVVATLERMATNLASR